MRLSREARYDVKYFAVLILLAVAIILGVKAMGLLEAICGDSCAAPLTPPSIGGMYR